MDIEEHPTIEQEQQIMILIDGLQDNQENQDLLEMLVAQPPCQKKKSLNYDYKPAPTYTLTVEEPETTELKTSSTSTSTSAEIETPVRRCFCQKTRCLKNYCQCFKLGLACTADCQCNTCGNRERLFLTSSNREIAKCKCQKSHCLKKYCECHSSGRKCGPACKCADCYNIEETMEDQKNQSKKESMDIDHLLILHSCGDI